MVHLRAALVVALGALAVTATAQPARAQRAGGPTAAGPEGPRARRAAGTTDPEARKRYDQGLVLMRAQNWAGAVGEFSAAVSHDPNFADAHTMLGVARGNLGQFNAAVSAFEKALELDPDHLQARIGLAQALDGEGKHDRAIEEAKRALAADENRPEVHVTLGQLYGAKTETLGLSVEHFRRAAQLRGSSPELRLPLAQVLRAAQRPAEAADELRLALQMNPPNAALYHRQLGLVCLDLEQYLEARKHLVQAYGDKSLRGNDLYAAMVAAAYRMGNYGEAWVVIQEAGQAAPNDPSILLTGANILRYLGAYNEADQLLLQALSVDPRCPGADYERGLILLNRNRYVEAVESLRRATEIDPHDARAWYGLGVACRAAGMIEESDRALATFKDLKDASQDEKEKEGIEAGPPPPPEEVGSGQ